jgi:hypothetical protein
MKAIRGLLSRIAVPAISLLALVGLVLSGPQAAWAKHSEKAAEGPDPTNVAACGTLAGSDTIYILTNNLVEAGTGTCITMSGTGSALFLNGFNITGPGSTSTGDGIHITGTRDAVEGFNGTVSGFAIGVLDSGGSVGDDVNVSANKTGLELNAGVTARWANFSSFSNTGAGVFINGCSEHCSVVDFATTDNGGDGLLIQGSAGANADVFIAADNGANGVELGGTTGAAANTFAVIADAFLAAPNGISNNVDGNGVVLDSSESAANDMVTTVDATGNGNGTTSFDLYDVTSTCGKNLWFNNTFDTSRAGAVSSPACIGGLGI